MDVSGILELLAPCGTAPLACGQATAAATLSAPTTLGMDHGSKGSCSSVQCPALAGTIALCAPTYLGEAVGAPVPEEESGHGHPSALWVASWMKSSKITTRGCFSEALSPPLAALQC